MTKGKGGILDERRKKNRKVNIESDGMRNAEWRKRT